VGHGFLGCNGETGRAFRSEKYLPNITVTVPASDFAAALAVAGEQAAAAGGVEKAEAVTQAESAKSECPAGFVVCTQKWSNGDLCSALYVTEDGTEVLGSDLLENHGGFYWIDAAEVAKARAVADQKKADAEAKKASRSAALVAVTTQARETGKDVEVERWTEECDGSVDECSTDLLMRSIQPDGTTTVSRIHTH